jgi:hypothetical protein
MKNPFVPSGGIDKEWGTTFSPSQVLQKAQGAIADFLHVRDQGSNSNQNHLCTGSRIATNESCN